MEDLARKLKLTGSWKIDDSLDLYGVNAWGNGYFHINEAGHVQVTPAGPGTLPIDLKELAARNLRETDDAVSTIARRVAARLGYRHIDTGAMYRALAWKAGQDGVDLADEAALPNRPAKAVPRRMATPAFMPTNAPIRRCSRSSF